MRNTSRVTLAFLLCTSAAAALLWVFCTASTASAAPILYDETTSGDLPQDAHLISFTFDVGANVIRAITTGGLNGGDVDGFNFAVPSNTQVTSASLQVFFLSGSGSVTTTLDQGIVGDPGAVFLESISVPAPGTGQFTTIPATPLVPGLYSAFSFNPSTLAIQLPYILTFNVVATPEPSGLAATVMVALAWRRRQQRHVVKRP